MSKGKQLVKSVCALCRSGCGVLIHQSDGKVTKIEGDPDSLINRGQLCIKGLASLELLYSPERLMHPLKRVGERGAGKWQRISWDEALTITADELNRVKDNYGPEQVLFSRGSAKGPRDDIMTRLANAFGSPNVYAPAGICYLPTSAPAFLTYGLTPPLTPLPDYEFPPECILVWGANLQESNPPEYWATLRALEKGSRLMVIDPRQTDIAKKADLWLQPRPGSDLALALGMINVIINEGLYDRDFVENWTVGFDELRAYVQSYSPEKIAEITWLDADSIRAAARFYANNRPACIQWGNGIEINVNSYQTGRAVWILLAITGNFGVPGGNVQFSSPGLVPRGSPEFTLRDILPAEKRKKKISADDGMIPTAQHLLSGSIVRAISQHDPYPLRAALFQAGSLHMSTGPSQEVYEALNKLDFIAVADMFMVPTAILADVVLPVSSYLEYDAVAGFPALPVAQVQRKAAQIGECWSDMKIINELAKKLGLGKYFWDSEEQGWDEMLKPIGITFNELKKVVPFSHSPRYRSYRFGTPSGKVELCSSKLAEWGFDALPVYRELPETPYSDPELAKEYPLILSSGKSVEYVFTTGRQIPSLRASHPDPIVTIHPETAHELGIEEGDWVFVENKRGRITQRCRLSEQIDPRVVYVEPHWWFPERGPSEYYGWAESNVNMLTDNKTLLNREWGTPNLRGILCKVYRK